MHISGIQQVTIGVRDARNAYTWYKENFGFDVPILDDCGTAELMLSYTAGEPYSRHSIFALNKQGGGGFEAWQFTSREPQSASFEISLGDYGINIIKLKTKSVQKAYQAFKAKGLKVLGDIGIDPAGNEHFFIQDPFNNIFQVTPSVENFNETSAVTGGTVGAIIGVCDMEKSMNFYKNILGYDKVIYNITGFFDDLSPIRGSEYQFQRVLLSHSEPRTGPFAPILSRSVIELVRVFEREPKIIFKNRLWGDLGFINLCFNIRDMHELKMHCKRYGYPVTVDSNPDIPYQNPGTIKIGDAAGHITCIEDPNGIWIEFVEFHKVLFAKSLGWYVNLRKWKSGKPLPKWLINIISRKRIKD